VRLAGIGDDDVLGLDVAVDDAACVRMVECLAQIGADLADLAVAELALARLPRQRFAGDELGDEERIAVLFADLVEGDDPRVVEPGGGLGLAQRPSFLGVAGLDRLDRDRSLEPGSA